MAYNYVRAERMKKLSVSELKRRVDAKTLSSAAASYALLVRGIHYPVG